MLKRKIEALITEHLKNEPNKILLIDGARQIGKSFIVRYVGSKLFPNYIEINLLHDFETEKRFDGLRNLNDFYFQLSFLAGEKLDKKENTLIFLDEIQVYPQLLTLLKFLNQEGKYTYIASGSLLGVTLSLSDSIPMGSITKVQMYPLDFEEFLWANGVGDSALNSLKDSFINEVSLDEKNHNLMMNYFKKYLLVGGLPDAVNSYIKDVNVFKLRRIQNEIIEYYKQDASKYDKDKKLKVRKIYDLIPSNMENKKKRIVINKVEDKKGKRYADYENEFDYLISSGIALNVQAISNPKFPLKETENKNLLKLYLNDVGLLTAILYGKNPDAVLKDINSINLGSVYESVVASELKAHGFNLFYYDNRNVGEVDYLIDDYDSLTVLPIEVKSGKDYQVHSALNKFISNEKYNIKKAYVLSNERLIKKNKNIIYMPIYFIMFFNNN